MKQLLALVAAIVMAAPVFAQSPVEPPPPVEAKEETDDTVRLSVDLVQVDAVVTDDDGKPVTDLTADEFEVLQDGRPQQVTDSSYVDTTSQVVARAPSATTRAAAPPRAVKAIRPEEVRRTIAIVFDDLHLSFESVNGVKWAIKDFVEKQVQPGDLVAIVRTSGGVGALQQFTSDRRLLDEAVKNLRWNPRGVFGAGAFEPVVTDMTTPGQNDSGAPNGRQSRTPPAATIKGSQDRTEVDDLRTQAFAGGTLGSLSFFLKGMEALPGRKSMVLFSEGWSLREDDDKTIAFGLTEKLRTLTDIAAQGAVSIYTADARGFVNPYYVDASVGTSGEAPDKRRLIYDSQEPLRIIARDTGGSFQSNNDYGKQLRRAVDDLKGYYLIAYTPDAATFDPESGKPKFHSFEVRVKRPGLKVRSRSGFYGVTDGERAAKRTVGDRMTEAISSPFAASDVRLRLTPQFLSEPKQGGFVRAYLHVDARDLDFADDGEGSHAAPLNLVAVLFGENGEVISRATSTQALVVRDAELERVRQRGVVYTLNLPVDKGGLYQLRTAVRDAKADRLGSAQQIVEVPTLKNRRLALSGMMLAPEKAAPGKEPDGTEPTGAAVRRFRAGDQVGYAFAVYNAKEPEVVLWPKLDQRIDLWRDGRRVFGGTDQEMKLKSQAEWSRIYVAGSLRLSEKAKPGDYVLQVTVTDRNAPAKYRTSTQWIDFEVIE